LEVDMPKKRGSSAPAWQAILEDMRSLNRLTIEAVQVSQRSLEETIHQVDRGSRERDAVLAAGIRELQSRVGTIETGMGTLTADVGTLKADVGTLKADVGDLKLRTSALERGFAEMRVDLRTALDQSRVIGRLDNLEGRVTALENRPT
jgi:predicted RNase H-like nuclease (RuvC/YqgF family)